MKERVHNFRLPIFNPCNVWFVLTDNVGKSRASRSDVFGPWDGGDMVGLFSYDHAGKFALFLRRGHITHGLIAHEIFHAAIRTLEYCEVTLPHGGSHEAHAYLCEHLTEIVYRDLKRWGENIL